MGRGKKESALELMAGPRLIKLLAAREKRTASADVVKPDSQRHNAKMSRLLKDLSSKGAQNTVVFGPVTEA